MIKRFLSISFAFIFAVIASCFAPSRFNQNSDYYCSSDFRGAGENPIEHVVETKFDKMDLNEQLLELSFPVYNSGVGVNGCAPTAGSMVVSYYDVNYTNLIPNYEPGMYYKGRYWFNGMDMTTLNVMQQLYNLMGTNTENPGTSYEQFKTGLKAYFNKQGYNISYNNFGSISPSTSVKQFDLQKPVVLFLTAYDYYPSVGVSFDDNCTTLMGLKKQVGHVVVAYGYSEFKYYNSKGLFKTDKYYAVAFGDASYGYLGINSDTVIHDALTINFN